MGVSLENKYSEAYMTVLQFVSMFDRGVNEVRTKKDLLERFKSKRRGLKYEEIKARGLNIYPRKETTIDELFEQVKLHDWMVEVMSETGEIEVKLTDKGYEYLISKLTNDFSDEYNSFINEAATLFTKKDETAIKPLHLAKMFHSNNSLFDVEKYLEKGEIAKEMEHYHKASLNALSLDIAPGEYVFNLFPKLYLPEDGLIGDVSLSINGVSLQHPIRLIRPYPNKRYVVAGIETDQGMTGIYLKTKGLDERIQLRWTIGDGRELYHTIKVRFCPDKGRFFSTCQRFVRSSALPTFDVISIFEPDTFFTQDRDLNIISFDGFVTEIQEHVELSSFPMHLHYTQREFRMEGVR